MIKGEYMTRFFNSRIRTKLIVLFSVLCLLFSCIGLYACGGDKEVKDPTYSVEEEDNDVLIKNASFDIGTYGIELKNYPITAPKSWSKAQVDNGSASSSVNSGSVDTTESSWVTILKTLYADSDFESFTKNVGEFTETTLIDGVKAEKGDNNYEPKEEELVEYAIKNYVNVNNDKISYANPGTSPDADDDYIYMLNNVGKSSNFGLGLAQKITSSSTVTMKKDKVYEVSVWVKTANLLGQGEIGANIRLTNNFDTKAQKEYRISNIVAKDWTKYSIYVKADADYAGTFTLVLGLGYGDGDNNASRYYTEGTAYFDEITVNEIDAEDFTETLTPDYMVLGGEEPIEANLVQKADKHFACLYEMNLAQNENNYLNALTSIDVSSTFTTSNVTVDDGSGNIVPLTSATKVGAASTQTLTDNNDGSYTMAVNKASATVKVDSTNFSLNSEEYALISFYVKNELVAPADTNVYVDVIDIYNGVTLKRASTFTIAKTEGEYTRHFLLVKNNFTNGFARQFYLNLIVGPNDVASVVYDSDFSTGNVIFKDFKIAKDSINEDLANEDFQEIYTFLSSKTNASVALHAGYESEYTESEDSTTYDFATRPGNFGDVMFNPTSAADYTGIVPNHTYIKVGDDAETYVDTRIGKGTTEGVAGLINTKYLSNYNDGADIKAKLGFEDGDDNMQLLMINNKTANHYGFVGNKLAVASGAYGVVSVTLKVCEGATAYVYLTDVSGTDKNVLTFDSFTVNTDVVDGVEKGSEIDGSTLRYELKVTPDMMNADGFVTVSFYLGAGATAKSFRVEVWNGGRDGEDATASEGYVFVKRITSSTTSGFSEGESWNSSFTVEGNPLYENHKSSFNTLYAFERQLTDLEIKYNKEYPDSAISYNTKYVWAKSNTVVYGVFNSIDPVYNDPYKDIEEDEDTSSGCAAKTDPSTFWLSFSSILLAVILVAAIIVLVLKRAIAKRKANKSDALSHYKVTSRVRKVKKTEKVTEEKEETPVEETEVEEVDGVESEETEETTEENNDNDYIYGEVQSFGEETETSTDDDENN